LANLSSRRVLVKSTIRIIVYIRIIISIEYKRKYKSGGDCRAFILGLAPGTLPAFRFILSHLVISIPKPHFTKLIVLSGNTQPYHLLSSILILTMPSEVALKALQNELEGNVFRGVHGFFPKYFEGKTWSAAVRKMIWGTVSDRAAYFHSAR